MYPAGDAHQSTREVPELRALHNTTLMRTSLSPLKWSETGMAQTRVASLDNALMVVRNPRSYTGLKAAGLGATLPPPGVFCGVTSSWPLDMATRDETTATLAHKWQEDRKWQMNPVFLTQKWSNDPKMDQQTVPWHGGKIWNISKSGWYYWKTQRTENINYV